MNSLPILIENLLLTRDYVVVPGLGTFIAQPTVALRIDAEEAFLPPVRLLRFNADLRHEDSLLAKSISCVYDTTDEQAGQMLSNWVAELLQAVDSERELEFGNLGMFTRKNDGTLVFTSPESGIASPDYYGLDAFHISEVQPEPRAKIVPMTATMETSDKEITIRINRRIANFFVAACAAVVLFIVFNNPLPASVETEQRSSVRELLMGKLEANANAAPTEVPKTEQPKRKTVVLLRHIVVPQAAPVPEAEQPTAEPVKPQPVVSEPAPKAPESPKAVASTSVAPKAVASTSAAPKAVAKAPEVPKTAVSTPAQQAPQYCIVMASAISKKNAENYVERLRSQGFNNPRVLSTSKMTRVVVGNYASESEAYNVAEAMRRNSRELESVWILKL